MSHLRGSLQSIALSDVLQLLHINRKTGKLFVTHDQEKGILFVRNGEVIHAEMGDLAGEPAAFNVLEWEKGLFEFATPAFNCPNSINRSLPDLLMEGARTCDTRRRFRSIFPNLRAVPWARLQGHQLESGIKLFPEDHRVIPYLDGYRCFSDVITASGENEVTVCQTCMTLRDANRLEVFEPEQEFRVTLLKSGLFRKVSHIELSIDLEVFWSTMGPNRQNAIQRVRLSWPGGSSVQSVHFVGREHDKTVAVPKDLMQAWGIPEGSSVKISPAP
ncbi:MAG: hisitidine kinase [Holophagaceae bacterium]|nr:hisitidine kinase [Holophagaceae bacterium]